MNNTNDMHIDGFAIALQAFDDALDTIAKAQRNHTSNSACSGWVTISGPDYGDQTYTTKVYPTMSDHTCDCTCGSEKKVSFDDILDDVQQVIYNDPATIVTFSDGSKVCVKACSNDKFNKETGLIYALIKRLYADDVEEKTGYLRSRGLGEKISKIVSKAVDQKENERVRRRKQKQAKKDKEKSANETTPPSEKPPEA